MSLELVTFANPLQVRRPMGTWAPRPKDIILLVTGDGFETLVSLTGVSFKKGQGYDCLWLPVSKMSGITATRVATFHLPKDITMKALYSMSMLAHFKNGPKGHPFPLSWSDLKPWTISS